MEKLSSTWPVGAVVGIKRNDESITNDTVGIIKNWTAYHANVSILKKEGKIAHEATICWKDIFFCVPWDYNNYDENDYEFTFVDTLHPTQFYATRRPIFTHNFKCEWDPIDDNYDELTRNTNTSRQEITVTFKNGRVRMRTLPLCFDLTTNQNEEKKKDTSTETQHIINYNNTQIRLPSVIQQIPVVRTRQYWKNVLKFDADIINQAFNIPQKIKSHLTCLQDKLMQESMHHFENDQIVSNIKYKPHGIRSLFDSKKLTNDDQLGSMVIYLSKSFILNKFCYQEQGYINTFTTNCICENKEDSININCNKNNKNMKFPNTLTKQKCLEKLINGHCCHSPQCETNDGYDIDSLQTLVESNDYNYNHVVYMCEFILQGLRQSQWKLNHKHHWDSRQQFLPPKPVLHTPHASEILQRVSVHSARKVIAQQREQIAADREKEDAHFAKRVRSNAANLRGLSQVKQFYTILLDNPEEANGSRARLDKNSLEGDEAYAFLLDPEELRDPNELLAALELIQEETDRITEYHAKYQQEFERERNDFQLLKDYYGQLLENMEQNNSNNKKKKITLTNDATAHVRLQTTNQELLMYVLYEYCRALNMYNKACNWKDKDIVYLCHYYLSLFIAMVSVNCKPISNANINRIIIDKYTVRLAIARGMLAQSYWHIGTSDSLYVEFISAAKIHFELCVGSNENIQIAPKLCLLAQGCRSNDVKCCRNNPGLISISDVLTYQKQWLNYASYLRAQQLTERETVEPHDYSTNTRVTELLCDMIKVFGYSLEATTLTTIYGQLAQADRNGGDIGSGIAHTHSKFEIMMGRFYQSLYHKEEINEMIDKVTRDLSNMIQEIVDSDEYKKVKLKKIKIKSTKTKGKVKKNGKKKASTAVTKETIKSGKYLRDNPKLLLLAACCWDIKLFQHVAQNFHKMRTVIKMTQASGLIALEGIYIHHKLSLGKHLFALLKYCCDGNVNLCNDQEIKIMFHFYFVKYYQIISSSNDIQPFEWNNTFINSYNHHIGLIINHFHLAFLELMRFNDKTKNQQIGMKITISYINFLLSIWDTKNLTISKKKEIKKFWINNFSEYNYNNTFMSWLVDSTINTRLKQLNIDYNESKVIMKHDYTIANEIAITMIGNIDLMYSYTLLQFKMGNDMEAYEMLRNICTKVSEFRDFKRDHIGYGSQLQMYDVDDDYRDYSFRNDFCLHIDSITTALQATGWGDSILVVQPNTSNNGIVINNSCSYLSKFCGFDQESLLWLFGLFDMNCRGLREQSQGLPNIAMFMSRDSLRQIRTSLFFFCMRLGSKSSKNINSNNSNYDRLYWLQFGMVSIGIQSLLWIDCDKFGISNNNYNIDHDYKQIVKYLYRFVINYIESGLKFPITLNKRVSTVAQLCLILAYFIIDETEKIQSIFNNYIIDQDIIDVNWYKMIRVIYNAVVKDVRSDYFANVNKRISFVVSVLYNLQTSNDESTDNQRNVCNILQRPKNSKLFVKWKNAILKRNKHCDFCYNGQYNRKKDFLVCKGCKNAYYCNKKCQKRHWAQHKKNCRFQLQ